MSDTPRREKVPLKDRLEALCIEMIDRGILFSEAVEQFEKCFITEVVTRRTTASCTPPAVSVFTATPSPSAWPNTGSNGCSRGVGAAQPRPPYQTDSR